MRKKYILAVTVLSVTLLAGCSSDAVETFNETIETTENEVEVVENDTEEAETKEAVENGANDKTAEAETPAPTTAPTEKPVETAKPVETTKPVETAKPTATAKPAATPTPTPKPHTHSYVLTSSTSGNTCVSGGIDTFTCSCGDSYTTSNGNTGSHTWTTENWTETIHYPAEYGAERGYTCDCGEFWTDCASHIDVVGCGFTTDVREYEVSPAHDEVVTHSRTYCTSCGREQ